MDILKIKPVKNKANGQLSFSVSKKLLPKKVKDILKTGRVPTFDIKLMGYS